MHEFSKSHKRRLTELSARLYERDVEESLTRLSRKFDDWKAGKITGLALSELLHEYDHDESGKLRSRYDTKQHDMIVAHGFVQGFLTEADIGPDLIKELENAIKFYREQKE